MPWRFTTSWRGRSSLAAYSIPRAEYGAGIRALDFLQRRRVLQCGCVAEFFAQIRCTNDAAHHLCVSCFWYVTNENDFPRRERFPEIVRDVLFQFGGEGGIAICIFLQHAKANERFTFDGIRDANGSGFTHLRVRDKN